MGFLYTSEHTATISIHNIKWLVLFKREGGCLLRGTNLAFITYRPSGVNNALLTAYWSMCIILSYIFLGSLF